MSKLIIGKRYRIDSVHTGTLVGYDESLDPIFKISENIYPYVADPNGNVRFLKRENFELVPDPELTIGKVYYFGADDGSYGAFLGDDGKDIIFAPIRNPSYHVEPDGTVRFASGIWKAGDWRERIEK